MEWNQPQIERIRKMESYFDMLTEVLKLCGSTSGLDEEQNGMLKELLAYYDGGEWMSDFRADEDGLIPKTLKQRMHCMISLQNTCGIRLYVK